MVNVNPQKLDISIISQCLLTFFNERLNLIDNIPTKPLPQGTRNLVGLFLGLNHGRL